jgi:light-regulated signal transduction histidine kinase (bacteriophytochrome)
VQWVPGFEDALGTIQTGGHDVCLLDYRLGERTGLELLREVQGSGVDLPVILLTGRGSFELDLEAMELGAFDYLDKADISPALLERSIRYTIENHRARAALEKANEELELRVQERTAELRRSNRDLEQFANVVARDLQAPLQAITDHIEKMKSGGEEGAGLDRAYHFLEPVLHAARNMELMLQSVLDYSRVGREARPSEIVDLAAVAEEVCAELDDMMTEAGATIEVGSLPAVHGDAKLLAGLFENLLSNAMKFRGEQPPRIRLSAERKGDWWLCGVSDNGIGVEEEDEDEIFLMFARGPGGADYPGIGIGLAMCRRIVQYHGGKIWVDSNPDGGSTFYFTFPAE